MIAVSNICVKIYVLGNMNELESTRGKYYWEKNNL